MPFKLKITWLSIKKTINYIIKFNLNERHKKFIHRIIIFHSTFRLFSIYLINIGKTDNSCDKTYAYLAINWKRGENFQPDNVDLSPSEVLKWLCEFSMYHY